MLRSGETTSDSLGCDQVVPEIGITATPVIDPLTGPHGTIYVVAMSKNATSYFQRLHALDLTTGVEQFGGPVKINATYPGTGDNSNGQGQIVFDPKQYKERSGLVLNQGIVYTFWASHCDQRPYTGWIIGYDKNTLAQSRVLNLTPNGNAGAIWGNGAAPAVDASGKIYLLNGNGTFETTLDANGFPTKSDFGNCIVKVGNVNQQLRVVDYWTMFNTINESKADQDLGSGGAVLLPPMVDINGVTRNLLAGAGKDKHIYIADRNNLGKFNPSSNANLNQDVKGLLLGSVFSVPAYFNGHLYYGAVGDRLKSFAFSDARLVTSPTSRSVVTFGYPGTTPSVSANGAANAIIWAAQNSTPAVLYAFDATNLGSQLYSSTMPARATILGMATSSSFPQLRTAKCMSERKTAWAFSGYSTLPT
jgi:3',5'-cyclic AMP phosphodiesterase CpdA